MKSKAIFLDRDGVINRKPPDHDYVKSVSELKLLPGIKSAIKFLKNKGYLSVVVTNQRGISLGHFNHDTLAEIHAHINFIAALYYCHHAYHHQCNCRKPKPGLILQAASELNIDLSVSHLIGDSQTDIQAAHAAGVKSAHLLPTNSPILPLLTKIL